MGIRYIVLLLFFSLSESGYSQKVLEFLPEKSARTAVIICPGGSYCWLSKKYEGIEVAEWLKENGIAAYVLYYPTAGWAAYVWHTRYLFRGTQYPDQIRALEKTLADVRSKGYQSVGAMGFSAGGHLVLNAAEYTSKDIAPDFVAAIYPVVTLSHPDVHRRSRRGLLGERRWKNREICDFLSMEMHAERITCPVFLINCEDDPVVKKHNSELMDSALTVNSKPHFYRQFKTGGHGFGVNARRTSATAITWKGLFLRWLKEIGH